MNAWYNNDGVGVSAHYLRVMLKVVLLAHSQASPAPNSGLQPTRIKHTRCR